jgi:site-specific recombinase XerD
VVKASEQQVHIFFTGTEARKPGVPFLLDEEMRPITAANSWLREVAADGSSPSRHTHRTYAYELFDFFKYLIAHEIDWRKATNDDLIDYRDAQDQYLSSHTKKPLNRNTINARLMVADRFYTHAAKERFIEKHPFKHKKIKVRRPTDTDMLAHLGGEREVEVPSAYFERVTESKIKWRPYAEVMEWINSIDVWRDKLLAKLLYRTGMRREEIATWKIRELPKREEVNTSRPEVVMKIIGKGRKERNIILATRDFIELHDYIKMERARLVRKAIEKHNFIFVGRNGQHLRPNQINRIFKRISEKCGIKITPHMMRHSFAVFALHHWKSIGMHRPEKLLQARLGHASEVTTRRFYMHSTDEMIAEEAHANASLIERFLGGELNETE